MPQTRANKFICLLDHTNEEPLANIKMEHQIWPEKPLILGRSGTLYVAMVTKLVTSYCGAHLAESYCKESKNFWNKLAEISFFIIFDQNYFGWVYDFINWLICIFQKLKYLWNEKRYFKIVNSIFLLIETTFLCFKMALIRKMRFSS